LESILSIPIVLPPTVLGFYLLIFFSKDSFFGSFLDKFDISLLFTFPALVIASCIYSLPFMIQPIINAFEKVDKNLIYASYSLQAKELTTFFKVILPNIYSSIIIAMIMSFAHTMGEFGVVLMIGGSIDGVSKVASITIYEYVEELNYTMAHIYSLIMLSVSFIILLITNIIKNKSMKYA
jgi:molybdate transport system permease protein